MERSKYHRILFLFAAVFNWVFCAVFLVLARVSPSSFIFIIDVVPNTLLFSDLFAGFLLTMGLGYYYVTVDFNKNRNIVRMGIVIKAFKAIIFTSYAVLALANPLMFLFAGLEIVFFILFLEDHLMST